MINIWIATAAGVALLIVYFIVKKIHRWNVMYQKGREQEVKAVEEKLIKESEERENDE